MGESLPEGWTARQSSSNPGKTYYINSFTKQSQWEVPTEAAEPHSEDMMRCSHLLVKHEGSRNPKSWRQDGVITRTKDEAMELLMGYRKRIEDGEDFGTLAKEFSDCGSARNCGDLGPFGPGQMQKAFEDATKVLSVGEMSGAVDSDSGLHIIKRTAIQ
ncbi:peptidyl-prolyl cis-trans isomerase NIMA-interacting 1 [Sphaeroforma arctica JP610]|uniref:Peptidyl-prolyl cis-trans isomerase n=1 Tax=Sphaeroforma arctica JP610 TaxID=667725 RepID=A0A0L0G5W0_9EUKA|nr:peptidyl-prolyl cis-trans isomerase NIMA-interacting 1 [Sphaeroforma arctica JP610]KNC84226.1 peptidyl-prolyl cis-trans isomerase NIMA-interacting 1 [Sphaeroforma arctica JP610]|eukprot:XP_014158128.1 peptidyl-prolyl cis-trans isomerase NIMA-interacting 1 [Sphaeroforma arctica JP610]